MEDELIAARFSIPDTCIEDASAFFDAGPDPSVSLQRRDGQIWLFPVGDDYDAEVSLSLEGTDV